MKGLICIPDISGFTNFVKQTNLDLGGIIMHELLSQIIDSNELDLELSEIEGDAVLFYRIGIPISLNQIFPAINNMYDAFTKKCSELRFKYKMNLDLSLKFILHYGEMTVYHIRGFKKLYGPMIIESHRLLKNGSGYSDYILITDDYFKAMMSTSGDPSVADLRYSNYSSQLVNDQREIQYYFFQVGDGTNSIHFMQNMLA